MHIRTDMHKKKTQAMPQHMRSEVGELLERIKELSAITQCVHLGFYSQFQVNGPANADDS